jgi:hypothetical protein
MCVEPGHRGLLTITAADLAPDMLVPWRHPTLTVVYALESLSVEPAGLVPVRGAPTRASSSTDVSAAMAAAGDSDDFRLTGGVTVMLYTARLRLDVRLRATGDATFVQPHVFRRPSFVREIEALGYENVLGNRWERGIDDRRIAASNRARARSRTPFGGRAR